MLASFNEFVDNRARVTRTPTGDFIQDWRADMTRPSVRYRRDLMTYLRRIGACPEAIEAAKQAWRNYASWRNRNHDQ